MSDNWIKNWISKKIKYYENYLNKNHNSPIKNEVEESIRILKDLL